jgi:hypothetical protein
MKKILIITLFGLFSSTMFAQDQSMWSLTYNMSFPMGATKDYISKASFRGVALDGRWFVDNNVTVGGNLGWNVFYEKIDNATITKENLSLNGTQWKYINAVPMFFNAAYYLNDGSYVRPYLAANIGTIFTSQRTEMGMYALEDKEWKFAFAPEVGVTIETYNSINVMLNVRYNYGLETEYIEPLSYIGVNVGILWTY